MFRSGKVRPRWQVVAHHHARVIRTLGGTQALRDHYNVSRLGITSDRTLPSSACERTTWPLKSTRRAAGPSQPFCRLWSRPRRRPSPWRRAAIGLDVAPVEPRVVSDRTFLLVQRYDRAFGDDGNVRRIHQEDFCQALGVPPETKYASEGGPTFKDCFELLRPRPSWSSGRPLVSGEGAVRTRSRQLLGCWRPPDGSRTAISAAMYSEDLETACCGRIPRRPHSRDPQYHPRL